MENNNLYLKEMNDMLTRYIGGLNKLMVEQGRLKMKEKRMPIDMDQLPVLMCIFLSKQITKQEIAAYVHRDKSSIKRTIAQFQKKGLVEMRLHEHDKRKTIVSMTDTGNFVAEQLKAVMHEIENSVFSFMTKKSRKELLETLKKIFEKNRKKFLPNFSTTAKVVMSPILLFAGCLPTVSYHLSKIIF
ncbi:MAG: MarR family transcriptional regulator [Chitinophagaceae bacterium]|jgi:DNA-binding MarR family transcriptional regulator|nr:MarR family transcriptional regulator [Chitinophagaceae bacterium]